MSQDEAIDVPADAAGAEQAADLERLEMNAANEDFAPGDDALGGEAEAAEIGTGEMCSSLLMIGFNLVGSRRGPHWNLSPEEATETGNAIGAVLDKYFPDLSSQGVELTALMTCAMVLTPRLMTDKQLQAQSEQNERIEAQRQRANEASDDGGDGGDQPQH